MKKRIAFQGAYGAYSDLACRTARPDMDTVPCPSFEDAFRAVHDNDADFAMIPVDNSIAGRVADVHHLMPDSGLYIVGEHFQPIPHCLLGVKGATLNDLEYIHSHVHAIPQCRDFVRKHNLTPIIEADTAGAAARVARDQDKRRCAISSELAAEIYDLDILKHDIQDAAHNTTRFLIFAREPEIPEKDETQSILTSLVFQVRNIPAALYKATGGFATNGVNMAKLESYVDERFQAARFFCDVEGHPDDRALILALEELDFFAKDVKLLGSYSMHPFRLDKLT